MAKLKVDADVLRKTSAPTTAADEVAVFASDGTGGLTDGHLYVRPPSSGTPIDLSAGSTASTVVTWDPDVSVSVPSAGIYKTWAEVQAAAVVINAAGGTFDLRFHSDAFTTFNIPAGGPYLSGQRWLNDPRLLGTYVTIQNGATFSTWPAEIQYMDIESLSLAYLYSGNIYSCKFTLSSLACDNFPALSIAGTAFIELDGTSNINGPGRFQDYGSEVIELQAAANLTVNFFGQSATTDWDMIKGPVGSTLILCPNDMTMQLYPNTTMATMLGTYSHLSWIQTQLIPNPSVFKYTTNQTANSNSNNRAYGFDTTSGNRTLTLPDIATLSKISHNGGGGRPWAVTVKHVTTDANKITLVRANPADFIEGAAADLDLTKIFDARSLYAVRVQLYNDSGTYKYILTQKAEPNLTAKLPHPAVRVATTGNVNVTPGSSPLVVDGVTLIAGDRVLPWQQTSGTENGPYVVVTPGTGSDGTWARAGDADNLIPGQLRSGDVFWVSEGTQNSRTRITCVTSGVITIGSTSTVFIQEAPLVRTDAASTEIIAATAFTNGTIVWSSAVDMRDFSEVSVWFNPTALGSNTQVDLFIQWSDDGATIPFATEDGRQQTDFLLNTGTDGTFKPKDYVARLTTSTSELVAGTMKMLSYPKKAGSFRFGVMGNNASGSFSVRSQRLA